MGINVKDLLTRLQQIDPEMAKSPFAESGLSAIVNNDISSCETIAKNFMNSLGVDQNQFAQQAVEWGRKVGLVK